MNILDIKVPLIAAVNGPVRLHSEYILLADIVLATPSAVFQDKPHFEFGIVPGDGVNLLWQEVIGSVRDRSGSERHGTGVTSRAGRPSRRRQPPLRGLAASRFRPMADFPQRSPRGLLRCRDFCGHSDCLD